MQRNSEQEKNTIDSSNRKEVEEIFCGSNHLDFYNYIQIALNYGQQKVQDPLTNEADKKLFATHTANLEEAVEMHVSCLKQTRPSEPYCTSSHQNLYKEFNKLHRFDWRKESPQSDKDIAKDAADLICDLEKKGEMPLITKAKKKVADLKNAAALGTVNVNNALEQIKEIQTAQAKSVGCYYGTIVTLFTHDPLIKQRGYLLESCVKEESDLRTVINKITRKT